MMDIYTEQHWRDLITVIIERIGVEHFLSLTTQILIELGCVINKEVQQ